MHRAPDVGFDPRSPGARPGPKAGANPLHHPGIPHTLCLKCVFARSPFIVPVSLILPPLGRSRVPRIPAAVGSWAFSEAAGTFRLTCAPTWGPRTGFCSPPLSSPVSPPRPCPQAPPPYASLPPLHTPTARHAPPLTSLQKSPSMHLQLDALHGAQEVPHSKVRCLSPPPPLPRSPHLRAQRPLEDAKVSRSPSTLWSLRRARSPRLLGRPEAPPSPLGPGSLWEGCRPPGEHPPPSCDSQGGLLGLPSLLRQEVGVQRGLPGSWDESRRLGDEPPSPKARCLHAMGIQGSGHPGGSGIQGPQQLPARCC